MGELWLFLSDFTVRNVVLGALLLGVSSGVLGVFAVLRQQSLLGDTLSHAALPGVCLGFLIAGSRELLPIMLGALVAGGLASGVMLFILERSRLKTDAAQGIVLSTFFAFGVVLLTYINAQNNAGQAGLQDFLFGQAASILPDDVVVMAGVTLFSVILVLLFWKELKLFTFDQGFSGSLGLPVKILNFTMTSMIALAIVVGLQMVGVVLMAAMLIAPAVAARQWVRSLEAMALLAAVFGAFSGIVGALISAGARGLATGPVIVVCASLVVGISLLIAPERGLVWMALRQRRERHDLQERRVLLDLYHLAQEHDDPEYPSELGMLSSYYGFSAKRALRELKHRGWVLRQLHMPEEGPHYVLTKEGYNRAETVLLSLQGKN